jgi:hypothetical protein
MSPQDSGTVPVDKEIRQNANATIRSQLINSHIEYQESATIVLDDLASGEVNLDIQFEPHTMPGTEISILTGLSPRQARELSQMLDQAATIAERHGGVQGE